MSHHLSVLRCPTLLLLLCGGREKAKVLYKRALAGCEQTHGPSHTSTLDAISNLADCLNNMGQYTEALPMHRKALNGFERSLGKAHPDTLDAQNDLAVCLKSLGQFSEALPLFRASYEVRVFKGGCACVVCVHGFTNYHPSWV